MIEVYDDIECTQKQGVQVCVTHAGVFHADEVLATAMLERVFGSIALARINKIEQGVPKDAIFYDIGYGPLDHHQPGGNGARGNGIPYAAAGLVWKRYGTLALRGIEDADKVWAVVDERLVQGIDAADNGVASKSGFGCYSLSQVVSSFNPLWNSDTQSNVAFLKAEALVREVLDNVIDGASAELRAEALVEQAIEESQNGCMILPVFLPWRKAFFASDNAKAKAIDFVIYPSNRGGYNWQAIETNCASRKLKKEVPINWWGLDGPALREICGVPDAVFCHRAGFIGGAEILYGACDMVERMGSVRDQPTLSKLQHGLPNAKAPMSPDRTCPLKTMLHWNCGNNGRFLGRE